MSEQRYCIIQDSDSHRWICPLDKKEEVEKNIEAIEEYWQAGRYNEECPDDLTHKYNLPTLEGGVLSFTSPQVDGKPVFKN